MLKVWNMMNGWAERLTISILGIVPGIKPESIQKVKEGFNTRHDNIQSAIDELKSEDPNNLHDWPAFEKAFKFLKVVVILAFILVAFKFYMQYKKK